MGETVRIIVNGYQKTVAKTKIIDYARIVYTANKDPKTRPAVTYDLPGGGTGTLVDGQVVRLKEGTIFTVTDAVRNEHEQ